MSHDLRSRLATAVASYPLRKVTQDGARAAAVLIPIVAIPEPTLLFTRRTETVSSHKGQISFPGGSVDATDPSFRAAALREAQEEIALDPSSVTVVGELDTFPTFVSGYTVTPFIGWLDAEPTLVPNPEEVAEVLHVPLASLTDAIRAEPGFEHGGMTFPTEAWIWEDRVIWGVTARIVRQFLEVAAAAGLVEAPGGDPLWWETNIPPLP